MNLKQLLNDLEELEKNIDSEAVMEDVKSDLKGCCVLLRDIMGEPQRLKTKEKTFDEMLNELK